MQCATQLMLNRDATDHQQNILHKKSVPHNYDVVRFFAYYEIVLKLIYVRKRI